MTVMQQEPFRRVLDSVFAAPAYRWVETPDPWSALHRLREAFRRWLFDFTHGHPIRTRVFAYLVVALIAMMLFRIAWDFFRKVDSIPADNGASAGLRARDVTWYSSEGERLASLGHFAEAMQYQFVALVVALDAKNVLHYHPSKTPGEYAREIAIDREPSEEFRELVRRLYSYAFARSPCGPLEYADWRTHASPERYARAN